MQLEGHRIAVTRPADGHTALADLLRRHGAEVVDLPLIRIAPPADGLPLRRAALRLSDYDWVVFTSAAGVRALAAVIPPPRTVPRARVAAVGSATAGAIGERLGWPVHAVPARSTGSALCDAMMMVAPVAGAAVLWPRARDARPELAAALRAAGATLDAPEAYCTEPVPEGAAALVRMAGSGRLSAITLTSPSAVATLAAAGPLAPSVVIAAIGPSTGEAARHHGITVHVEAGEQTAAGLVAALARYFENRRPGEDDER